MSSALTRIAAAFGLGVLLVLAAGLTTGLTSDARVHPTSKVRGLVPSASAAPTGVTARGMLLNIAQHARPAASDRQAGTASCLHLIRQDRIPGLRVIETTSFRQVNPDGSGLLWQQRTSDPDAVPTVTQYAAGELYGPIGEPVPADPVRLADAVTAATPAGSGSTAVVAVLLDLVSIRTLDRAHRAAVVRVLAMLPRVEFLGQALNHDAGTGYEFRFSDAGSDPIHVDINPDTAEILGFRLGGHTALQSSTTTVILHLARCDCPSPPQVAFPSAVLRTSTPPSAQCTTAPGVPFFHPADTSQGPRR